MKNNVILIEYILNCLIVNNLLIFVIYKDIFSLLLNNKKITRINYNTKV